MANITAKMVADLRAKTGAGMMDCKKALAETNGDMEEAVDFLRKKGLSAAAKKAGRAAAEGLIVAVGDGATGVLVEVNSETDFVAKNEGFQSFVNGVAQVVVESAPADLEALKALSFPETGRTVAEEEVHQVATIGENVSIRRFVRRQTDSGVVSSYVHGAGKIGVLVELSSSAGTNDKLTQLAHQLAMHVAAANPLYFSRDDVPAEVVAKEKEILVAKAKESGKPDNIIEKMMVGQINKYFGEICLLEQAYVIDPDHKVEAVVKSLAKELGVDVLLKGFERYQLGEGLERKEDDFASEVASLTKG